VELIQELITTI